MKKTFYLALLACLIAAGCSSDDDTPPAPTPEPYKFDTSVIHGTDGLIACAEIDKADNTYTLLGFYEASEYFARKAADARSRGDTQEADRLRQEAQRARDDCHATSGISFLSDGIVGMNYDGGLRINLSGFEVKITERYITFVDNIKLIIVVARAGDIFSGRLQRKEYDLTEVDDKYKSKDEVSMEFQVQSGDIVQIKLEIKAKGTLSSYIETETITGSASFYKLSTAGEKQGE